MLNLLSILIGLGALVFAIPGLVPLFGWLNYLAIPVALVGAGVGMLSSRTGGRNFNLLVLVVAFVRLWMLGGFL
jgi:hypothetical protein